MRVFNLNLTYQCNNNCLLCVSHNTREHTVRVFSDNMLDKVIQRYEPTNDDLIILSGGEPTLSPFIYEILDKLSILPSKTALYTNGRTIKDKEFSSFVCTHVDRIVFSVYGDKNIHNYYADNISSFEETFSGIQNAIQLKHQFPNLCIELKLICNKRIVDENLDLFSIIDLDTINNIDSLIFGRLLQRTEPSLTELQYIHNWVCQQIEIYRSYSIKTPIKLVDFWPCLFNNNLFSEISQSNIKKHILEVLFFDAANFNGKILEYLNTYKAKQLSSCANCFANTFCGDSITCFGALYKENDKPWIHVPE